ncbi:MAG: Aspartate carbamoyltransferase, partial [Cyanobacteriota bacterium]
PPTLVPDAFVDFVAAPPPGQRHDPVPRRGRVQVLRDLDAALQGADAVMTLRLQQERMQQNLLSSLDGYHQRYGLSHARLQRSGVPVLHPGPVNRGVEMTGALLDDPAVALVDEQVRNGIPVRMALLYLLAAGAQSSLNPSSSRP